MERGHYNDHRSYNQHQNGLILQPSYLGNDYNNLHHDQTTRQQVPGYTHEHDMEPHRRRPYTDHRFEPPADYGNPSDAHGNYRAQQEDYQPNPPWLSSDEPEADYGSEDDASDHFRSDHSRSDHFRSDNFRSDHFRSGISLTNDYHRSTVSGFVPNRGQSVPMGDYLELEPDYDEQEQVDFSRNHQAEKGRRLNHYESSNNKEFSRIEEQVNTRHPSGQSPYVVSSFVPNDQERRAPPKRPQESEPTVPSLAGYEYEGHIRGTQSTENGALPTRYRDFDVVLAPSSGPIQNQQLPSTPDNAVRKNKNHDRVKTESQRAPHAAIAKDSEGQPNRVKREKQKRNKHQKEQKSTVPQMSDNSLNIKQEMARPPQENPDNSVPSPYKGNKKQKKTNKQSHPSGLPTNINPNQVVSSTERNGQPQSLKQNPNDTLDPTMVRIDVPTKKDVQKNKKTSPTKTKNRKNPEKENISNVEPLATTTSSTDQLVINMDEDKGMKQTKQKLKAKKENSKLNEDEVQKKKNGCAVCCRRFCKCFGKCCKCCAKCAVCGCCGCSPKCICVIVILVIIGNIIWAVAVALRYTIFDDDDEATTTSY